MINIECNLSDNKGITLLNDIEILSLCKYFLVLRHLLTPTVIILISGDISRLEYSRLSSVRHGHCGDASRGAILKFRVFLLCKNIKGNKNK